MQAGEVDRSARAQMQEVPAGENRGKRVGGTAKSQGVEVGRVAGMMVPATRVTTTTVTHGATTSVKMTGK